MASKSSAKPAAVSAKPFTTEDQMKLRSYLKDIVLDLQALQDRNQMRVPVNSGPLDDQCRRLMAMVDAEIINARQHFADVQEDNLPDALKSLASKFHGFGARDVTAQANRVANSSGRGTSLGSAVIDDRTARLSEEASRILGSWERSTKFQQHNPLEQELQGRGEIIEKTLRELENELAGSGVS